MTNLLQQLMGYYELNLIQKLIVTEIYNELEKEFTKLCLLKL